MVAAAALDTGRQGAQVSLARRAGWPIMAAPIWGEMRMRVPVTIAVLALALAGCGKGNRIEERNASVGEVAKAVAKAGPDMKFMPGRWESKLEFASIEAPGMPPELVKAMQSATGRNRLYYSCLTPAQAQRPNADFFNKQSKDCTYEHFSMGGGRIDARMVCHQAADGTATVEMAGSYGADHYNMAMTTQAESGPAGSMTMKMKIDSHQVGECKGDESQAG